MSGSDSEERTSRCEGCCRHDLEQSAAVRARGRSGRLLREPLPMTKAFRLARHARHWSLRAITVTRLAVANSNMMLSSDSLETGTGSSNSLLSTKQSSKLDRLRAKSPSRYSGQESNCCGRTWFTTAEWSSIRCSPRATCTAVSHRESAVRSTSIWCTTKTGSHSRTSLDRKR
jgi:hypothetical protein